MKSCGESMGNMCASFVSANRRGMALPAAVQKLQAGMLAACATRLGGWKSEDGQQRVVNAD